MYLTFWSKIILFTYNQINWIPTFILAWYLDHLPFFLIIISSSLISSIFHTMSKKTWEENKCSTCLPFFSTPCCKNFYAFIPTRKVENILLTWRHIAISLFPQPEWGTLWALCSLFRERKNQPPLIAQSTAPKSVINWLKLFTWLARRISHIDR